MNKRKTTGYPTIRANKGMQVVIERLIEIFEKQRIEIRYNLNSIFNNVPAALTHCYLHRQDSSRPQGQFSGHIGSALSAMVCYA